MKNKTIVNNFENEVKNNAYFRSIFTHNLEKEFNSEKCQKQAMLNSLTEKQVAEVKALVAEVNKKYKRVLDDEEYKKYELEVEKVKAGYIDAHRKDFHIYSIEEAKVMFELAMSKLLDYAKKYDVAIPGYRFAINGGRSVNKRSFSFNSWSFICRNNTQPMKGLEDFLTHGLGGILWIKGLGYGKDVFDKAREIVEKDIAA